MQHLNDLNTKINKYEPYYEKFICEECLDLEICHNLMTECYVCSRHLYVCCAVECSCFYKGAQCTRRICSKCINKEKLTCFYSFIHLGTKVSCSTVCCDICLINHQNSH